MARCIHSLPSRLYPSVPTRAASLEAWGALLDDARKLLAARLRTMSPDDLW